MPPQRATSPISVVTKQHTFDLLCYFALDDLPAIRQVLEWSARAADALPFANATYAVHHLITDSQDEQSSYTVVVVVRCSVRVVANHVVVIERLVDRAHAFWLGRQVHCQRVLVATDFAHQTSWPTAAHSYRWLYFPAKNLSYDQELALRNQARNYRLHLVKLQDPASRLPGLMPYLIEWRSHAPQQTYSELLSVMDSVRRHLVGNYTLYHYAYQLLVCDRWYDEPPPLDVMEGEASCVMPHLQPVAPQGERGDAPSHLHEAEVVVLPNARHSTSSSSPPHEESKRRRRDEPLSAASTITSPVSLPSLGDDSCLSPLSAGLVSPRARHPWLH